MAESSRKEDPIQGNDPAVSPPDKVKLLIKLAKSKKKAMSPGKLTYKGFAGVYREGKNTSLKRKKN